VPKETGDVEDFHRRGSDVGVDHAIHRDGGDLGAVDPAVLSRSERVRVGCNRNDFAGERMPGRLDLERRRPLPSLPIGTAPTWRRPRSGSSRAWRFKDRHGPEQLAQAYRDMNIRDDG
jgi:hypothetical protein